MKTLLAIIALFVTGFLSVQPNQQPSIKYVNVKIDAKSTTDWLQKPIKSLKLAQANSGNAFYVVEGNKIKLYITKELPKPFNVTEFMAAVEAAQGQTNSKIKEDMFFNLNNLTSYGVINIDLWGHNRKVVAINGKQVAMITADLIYVAPNISKNYFYTILEGHYKASEPMLRKAYLVHLDYNKVPTVFQSRVWTEGASSVIKVGMGKPDYQQIKVGKKTAPIGGYPVIGFIDLTATAKAKPKRNQIYYIKYEFKGIGTKFALPIQIFIPNSNKDFSGQTMLGCPVCPVNIGYTPDPSSADDKGEGN